MKVNIELCSKIHRNCEVFLEENQRLSDALNDPRKFLPIYEETGAFMLLPKKAILSIREVTE